MKSTRRTFLATAGAAGLASPLFGLGASGDPVVRLRIWRRRADLYESFQHRFRDQVPALLLSHPVYPMAIRSEMQGVTLGPLFDPSDRLASIMQWYLIARRSAQPEAATAAPEP